MDVDHNTEPESGSTTYESTTTIESDDDDNTSLNQAKHVFTPNVNRMGSSIREHNYAEFVKPFQARLLAISCDGTQDDLFSFLDNFWEKVKKERNNCFTKSSASRFLCRRICHILLTVQDVFKNLSGICSSPEYFSKISRVLAVYMDLELKASSRGTEYGLTIIERMQYMLSSFLQPPDCHHDNEFILLTFIHMQRLVKAHKELVDLLFNRFVKPGRELFEPKLLSDRMYITYLVLYKKWIDIETSAEFKKKLIEMCKKHIQPSPSLRTNVKYAPFLTPNWAPNQNPTESFLIKRMNVNPLIEALKIPDNEDNSDIEIIDLQNVTPLQVEENQASDSTVSITKSMSSTSISRTITVDTVKNMKSQMKDNSYIFDEENKSSSTSYRPEMCKSNESIDIAQLKKEVEEHDEGDIIDLTLDEMDVEKIEDDLAWIGIIEPKAKCSLMLPPQSYGIRKVIDNIVILDDDEDQTQEVIKNKPNEESENSSDSNMCNFLEKTQSIEISTNSNSIGPSTGENTNTGYNITSPTDSGIIMNNSGRNTVCSLYDEELTDCGLTSNDETDPKLLNQPIRNKVATKPNFMNTTIAELAIETDSESSKNGHVSINSDNKLVHNNINLSNIDKINYNCDEKVVNNENNELANTIASETFEYVNDELKRVEMSLSETKLRCGPITKTYQSNKKPRPRMLTPTRDNNIDSPTVSGPILISPTKAEITLDDCPIVSKPNKINKIVNSTTITSSKSSSVNTGAVVFSMLPRQKPNVSNNFPSPTINTNNPTTSNNVVFSTTIIPSTVDTAKSVSSIINDWAKSSDDEFCRTDGEIDSDVEESGMVPPPSNILIRCDYFKTEPRSSPSPFRDASPYPLPNVDIPTSSKISQVGKNFITVRKSPAGSLPFFNLLEYYSMEEPQEPKRHPPRSKRVAFSNAVVEYKTEKIEDDESDLKLRFKKQPPQFNSLSSKRLVKKSILKKLPKPKPCSVILKKLPTSNKHVGDYITSAAKVASILIRRNSIHSTSVPSETKKDDGYTVWRRDYTTDYDDVLTEQRKSHKKKKSKRKRSRSLVGTRKSNKKRKKYEFKEPPVQQFSVAISPLNLNHLIEDPKVHIQFANELESDDNEIYNNFQTDHKKNLMSTPKPSIESPCSFFDEDFENNDSDRDPVFETNDFSEEEEEEEINVPNIKDEVMINKDIGNKIVDDHVEDEVMEDEIMVDQDLEDEIMIDKNVDEIVIEKRKPVDQHEIANNDETKLIYEPSASRLCEESVMISTLVLAPEADPSDDETVVSTTHECHEEIETEIVEESMEHETIKDTTTLPSDEILEPKPIETNENVSEESIPESQEIIISKTPDSEQDQLNISGCSEEILDTNKIIIPASCNIVPVTLIEEKVNESEITMKVILSDKNTVIDTPKTEEQLDSIDRLLIKKPAKVLRANSCLDEISPVKSAPELVNSKNGEGKNGEDSQQNDDEFRNNVISKTVISIKSSPPSNTGDEEYLIEEYIDEDEIVIGGANGVDLNQQRSEGDQSCASDEIPSPPFETVTPKLLTDKVDGNLKKMKSQTTSPSHSNEDVPSPPSPFDDVLGLKQFGTLEDDSSISEMENVGKRVNENFNEIDEEEENTLSEENEIVISPETGKKPAQVPDSELISSNQNDVTTTTLPVQKKKTLVQRPYNRHIKINNKKRNNSCNSTAGDIPETIVSSTTITTNHIVAIANQVEFNGTNNSSSTYNLFCQLNNDDYALKKRRGRPKGSKNKRKEITPQIPTFTNDLVQYSPLSPPPPLRTMQRRQSSYYQHHEIASSSAVSGPLLFNNNPSNNLNRQHLLPPPFNRQRVNYRTPSCDSDEQPLIHLKNHHSNPINHPPNPINHPSNRINHPSNPINHHEYERKHKKLKRNDSNSLPFNMEKEFLDGTKTYLKVQEARTIFVPDDIDKLIHTQTPIEPNMTTTSSPITTTYHRYDPGGGGLNNISIVNNTSSCLSDPITQSHQFVNYDTSSSPERILTQHEHNYSNDSFPHQLPQALLNASSLDYLRFPYIITAQQQFKTQLQYIQR